MKLIRSLVLLGATAIVPNVQAAAVGNITATLDWNSLAITGVVMTPTSVVDTSSGAAFSSANDVAFGYGNPFTWHEIPAVFDQSISKVYSDSEISLKAGYDSTSQLSTAEVSVNNASESDRLGGSFSYHVRAFKAASTGSVTFKIDYSVSGLVGIDNSSSLNEHINSNMSSAVAAIDLTEYIAAFNNELSANGGDVGAAEDAVEDAESEDVFLADSYFEGQDLLLFTDCAIGDCTSSVNKQGSMWLTFEVEQGKDYAFEADIEALLYSDVSAVPVPAAVWLFGSALLGLTGVARRKKS